MLSCNESVPGTSVLFRIILTVCGLTFALGVLVLQKHRLGTAPRVVSHQLWPPVLRSVVLGARSISLSLFLTNPLDSMAIAKLFVEIAKHTITWQSYLEHATHRTTYVSQDLRVQTLNDRCRNAEIFIDIRPTIAVWPQTYTNR